MKIYLLLIAVVFSLSACAKPLTGEIFLVTQGAESRKLGAVTVTAYSHDVVKARVESLASHFDKVDRCASEPISVQSEDCKFDNLPNISETAKMIFEPSMPILSATTTDSDGKYSIRLPNQNAILYAVSPETGRVWIVRVPAGTTKMTLNESNSVAPVAGLRSSLLR